MTVDFKLITFRDNAIGRDGITELIAWQNNFLHNTVAISVGDSGNGDDHFHDNNKSEGKKGTIRECAMSARCEDDSFLFYTVERGRPNQIYFLCTKYKTNTAEEFLDDIFNCILNNYGADKCKAILRGKHHIWQGKILEPHQKQTRT